MCTLLQFDETMTKELLSKKEIILRELLIEVYRSLSHRSERDRLQV
jgi:uncharacterized protein (UPF0297 family)